MAGILMWLALVLLAAWLLLQLGRYLIEHNRKDRP